MTCVAIDQGTTSTRAFAFDRSGEGKRLQSITHKHYHPHNGWVEHDPEELLVNIKRCLESIEPVANVTAVGIDNQGESCLAWDSETGNAIYPVIVWQDDRTQAWIDELKSPSVQKMVLERAGLPLDAYFSASKLGWIMRNIPEARKLGKKGCLRLGTTDAFFRDRLCQRYETDVTTASRTSLMNLQTCQWDEELCELFGVPIEFLPGITTTTGDLGTLDCGKKTLPLSASVVDQQAALYGHDCRTAGSSKMTFGTGAFALMVTGQQLLRNEGGTLPTVAWQLAGEAPTYALEGGVYAAASAINWAHSIGLFKDFNEINQFSKSSAVGSGLVFVPALAGLACPHWDRNARGAWLGISLETSNLDMMQAVLEGIAFRMSEVMTAMETLLSTSQEISIDGGMSANPYFCQFLANTLGREISISEQPELTARGTAALAASFVDLPISGTDKRKVIKPDAQSPQHFKNFEAALSAVQEYGKLV